MAQANQPSITRRQALSTLTAAAAAVAVAGSAVPSLIADPNAELVAIFNALPPMERLFMHQQIAGWQDVDTEYYNIFREKLPPEEARAVFEEWRSGFHPEVIALFESGEWQAPYL